MINRTEFTKRFAMLLDRFGRTMSEPGILEYYQILNEELTTEEFTAAAREIHRRDQFWPTPQRFIDAARGGSETELAANAWRRLTTAANQGQTPKLTPTERAALQAIGGFGELKAATHYQQDQLRRTFEAAHVAIGRGASPAAAQLEAPQDQATDDLAIFFGAGDDR